MEECIFCKVVRGEIPCAQVYSGDSVLAFLDIAPIVEGHTLIIPKTHYSTLWDLPQELAGEMQRVMQDVGVGIFHVTGATGLNVVMNNYKAAGQVVPHAHWHLIPRREGDGLMPVEQKEYESQEAMYELAAKIQSGM
jgi:histidine triad (HIT) family protein